MSSAAESDLRDHEEEETVDAEPSTTSSKSSSSSSFKDKIEWVKIWEAPISRQTDVKRITASYTMGMAGPDRKPVFVMTLRSQANKRPSNVFMYVPYKVMSINLKEAKWLGTVTGIQFSLNKDRIHEVRDDEGLMLRSLKLQMTEKENAGLHLQISQHKDGKKDTVFIIPKHVVPLFFSLISRAVAQYEEQVEEADDDE